MAHDDGLYLEHILLAIEQIEEYISEIDEEKFKKNRLIQDGVVRQLEIIGEAVKKLSEVYRASKPEIPWKDIAGMRDKLIHSYFGVEIGLVWRVAIEDLPPLKEAIAEGLQH